MINILPSFEDVLEILGYNCYFCFPYVCFTPLLVFFQTHPSAFQQPVNCTPTYATLNASFDASLEIQVNTFALNFTRGVANQNPPGRKE